MSTNITYENADWIYDQDGAEVRCRPAKAKPCGRCPFLVANFDAVGEPPLENEGTYLPATRSSLWHYGSRQDGGSLGASDLKPSPEYEDGLRGGTPMRCHIRRQDDPGNSASILFPRDPIITACLCTSTTVLQQRELLRYVAQGPTRAGLTPEGAAIVAQYMLGRYVAIGEVRDLDVAELLEHAHPALLDPAIGHEELAPISDQESRDWTLREAA